MIQLTRLNNKPLFVNADLIKFVEQAPDTLVTLVTGEKLVVRETAEEVRSLFVAFRRSVFKGLTFTSVVSPSPLPEPSSNAAAEHEPEK